MQALPALVRPVRFERMTFRGGEPRDLLTLYPLKTNNAPKNFGALRWMQAPPALVRPVRFERMTFRVGV